MIPFSYKICCFSAADFMIWESIALIRRPELIFRHICILRLTKAKEKYF
jgi:hypothetical protein